MSTRAGTSETILVVDGGGEIIETCTVCGGHQRIPMEPSAVLLVAMQAFVRDHTTCRRGDGLRQG